MGTDYGGPIGSLMLEMTSSSLQNAKPIQIRKKEQAYAPAPVPSLAEWKQLWSVWDLVTTRMISPDALMEQPIPLRNPLLFYLGHIPTLSESTLSSQTLANGEHSEDIHITRATNSKPSEPAYYHRIFERGIDPDVDDPSKCHDHSELPDVFPCLGDNLRYRERVKERITLLYQTERPYTDRCLGRALWIGFEHEGLHAETFLFMTIQSPNILPPPDLPRPDFAKLAKEAASRRLQNPWIKVPEQTFTIGYHDPESDDGPNRFFAWDNEREPYDITVPQIEAQGRPSQIPATWNKARDARGDEDYTYTTFVARHSIKTVWGPVPLSQALDWPVMASFDEVERYSQWAGAHLPTLHELRSIHEHVERRRITHKGDLCGLGDTGGAAEWTRTLFAPQPGFKAMDIYPGYSADFMDEKHMAVVGGSWALHPRIAGRKSFLNWWQKKYLWPWTEVDGGICGGFVDAFASPVVTSYDIN
ncbi:hypothetical protein FPANT_4177 [Fusarium pseudoanthophilum]|uniref:Sulfatase-modifying factor enzyme domain-containing protein n=1 Tax=Fusarium pseudoanthophilum TaxID=48495 RepID=A0A8H5PIN2_9HYPO|nr:hypothetical protein FPANT_4177 [Fusarium pseudoanthophilum]